MKHFFGKSWQSWISEYSKSHQHPINRILHKIGIPLILSSLPLLVVGVFSNSLLILGCSLFVIGWVMQFVGHAFEGKWPEFFHDWRFLFVGARWWWVTTFKTNKPND